MHLAANLLFAQIQETSPEVNSQLHKKLISAFLSKTKIWSCHFLVETSSGNPHGCEGKVQASQFSTRDPLSSIPYSTWSLYQPLLLCLPFRYTKLLLLQSVPWTHVVPSTWKVLLLYSLTFPSKVNLSVTFRKPSLTHPPVQWLPLCPDYDRRASTTPPLLPLHQCLRALSS